jgi:hypothetical protein
MRNNRRRGFANPGQMDDNAKVLQLVSFALFKTSNRVLNQQIVKRTTNFMEFKAANVSVDHRSLWTGMPEQLLYIPYIHSSFQLMSCITMPQGM